MFCHCLGSQTRAIVCECDVFKIKYGEKSGYTFDVDTLMLEKGFIVDNMLGFVS